MLVFNERTGEFEERLGPGEKPTIGSSPSSFSFSPSSYSGSSQSTGTSREQIREQVYDILSDILYIDVDEIDDDSFIEDDLGADAVDKADIIERVEEEFDIIILDDEADMVDTVEELIDLVIENLDLDYDEDEEDDDDWMDDDFDDEDDDDDDDFDLDDDDDFDDDDFDLDDEEDYSQSNRFGIPQDNNSGNSSGIFSTVARTFGLGGSSGSNPYGGYKTFDYNSRDAIRDHVYQVIADQLSVDYCDINEGSGLVWDLGCDSLDLVELIMTLEKEYDIVISDEQAERILTVGDAIDYIYYSLNDL